MSVEMAAAVAAVAVAVAAAVVALVIRSYLIVAVAAVVVIAVEHSVNYWYQLNWSRLDCDCLRLVTLVPVAAVAVAANDAAFVGSYRRMNYCYCCYCPVAIEYSDVEHGIRLVVSPNPCSLARFRDQ